MSIFKREMQRQQDFLATANQEGYQQFQNNIQNDPEFRAWAAETQARLIAWEPWIAIRHGWDVEAILASHGKDYQAIATLVSCCCIIDRERYMELYIKYRDHNEFTFQEFANYALLMAHEDPEFEWDNSTKWPLPVRPNFPD